MKPCSFEQVHGAQSIDFEIEDGNIAGLVVRRLRGTVNDEIEGARAEKSFQSDAVADIPVVMCEILGHPAQPLQISSGLALCPEKDGPHVVVDPMHLVALTIKMFRGFRADQAAGAGNEHRF